MSDMTEKVQPGSYHIRIVAEPEAFDRSREDFERSLTLEFEGLAKEAMAEYDRRQDL